MKKIIALIVFLFGSSASFGQTSFSYGLAGSFDINPYPNDENDFYKLRGRANFSSGLNAQIQLNRRLWIGTKVLYSTKNYKMILEPQSFYPGDPVISGKREVNFENYFLDVPLEVGYVLFDGDSYSMYGVVGLVSSFALAGNDHSSANGSYESLLFSQKIGFGNEYKFGRFAIILEPQFRFFLNQVHIQSGVKNPIHFGLEIKVLRKPAL